MLLIGGIAQLGSDIRAAHGQGTRGTWVAKTYQCAKDQCWWDGDFFLPDGRETRQSIQYMGTLNAVHYGLRVPALDTGNSSEVYPVTGSRHWVKELILTVIAAIGVILNVVYWTYWYMRPRRGGRHSATPAPQQTASGQLRGSGQVAPDEVRDGDENRPPDRYTRPGTLCAGTG